MYPNRPSNSKQKMIASFVVIAAVVVVTVLIKVYDKKQTASTVSSTVSAGSSQTGTTGNTDTSMTQTTPTTSSSATTAYKDGTYTATADYYVPHGDEDIKVTLTVKSGVVTDSSIVNSEGDPESDRYQEDFASEYKSYVVGKNLSDIHLSYVAGASDTTQGFNDALTQIINQAQA